MAKYIKCPRCELNYILEGEDYCYVCKSEMKHHAENDEDDLLDIEDMELCPICGQNYITEDQSMCDECKGKSKHENGNSSKDWKDDSLTNAASDVDSDDEEEDEEYNSGFSNIDGDEDNEIFQTGDDLEDDSPIDFAMEEEESDDTFDGVSPIDDEFETVEVPDDDDDDEEEEDEDDYDFGDDDLLGKRK